MSNEVYANMMEIACKAASGKAVAAMPDVCWTPPQTPATPTGVPVPYPNTGMASDCSDGSSSVLVSGQEVMLKNKSYFKKSTGNEAGSAPNKGFVTTQNEGKVYFNAWSMDVKFEGENVVRNLDLTTHNHGSVPGNTPAWPYLDKTAVDQETGPCADDIKKEKAACAEYGPHGKKDPCTKTRLGTSDKPAGAKDSGEADALAAKTGANECLAARRCALQPYDSPKSHCCHQQTAHHLIEASALHDEGRGGSGSVRLAGIKKYSENMAPCVCAEGVNQNTGTHGQMHAFQSASAAKAPEGTLTLGDGAGTQIEAKVTTYGEAKQKAIDAMEKVFKEAGCKRDCIAAQLDAYHMDECGMNDETPIKAVQTGGITEREAQAAADARAAAIAKSNRAGGAGSR